MTCIEKLRELHPEWDEKQIKYCIQNNCPSVYMDVKDGCPCNPPIFCEKCWERDYDKEIWQADRPESYSYIRAFVSLDSANRLERLSKRVGKSEDSVIEAALELYESALDAIDEGHARYSSMEIR